MAEQVGQQAQPVTSGEAVVGDDHGDASGASQECRNPARQAAGGARTHPPVARTPASAGATRWAGGAEVAHGAQNVDPQPVVLLDTRLPPERRRARSASTMASARANSSG